MRVHNVLKDEFMTFLPKNNFECNVVCEPSYNKTADGKKPVSIVNHPQPSLAAAKEKPKIEAGPTNKYKFLKMMLSSMKSKAGLVYGFTNYRYTF